MTYVVKIPDIENKDKYIEYTYKNVKEVSVSLGIAENTVYSILNGKCTFNKKCTMKLKDVIIYKEKKCDNYSEEVVNLMKKLEIEKIKDFTNRREKIQQEKNTEAKKQFVEFAKNMQLKQKNEE